MGDTQVKKHFALGRFSHELAYVMPDQRTVYLSDDGTNTGLFLFIADKAGDLSAGTLYAAKWRQLTGIGVGSAKLAWVNLGHATNAQIQDAIKNQITFNQMWDKTLPSDPNTYICPQGFTGTNTYDTGFLCVRLKKGAELLASRLETRLYAAYLGATTEFRKEEGITYNPDEQVLYISMSEVSKGMLANSAYDQGGPDHIRVATSYKCGAIYELDLQGGVTDTQNQPIASELVAVKMQGLLVGHSKKYENALFAANKCDLKQIANPDNLTYLPGYDTLLIAEDTDKHKNNILWAYDTQNQGLNRIATVPYGAEITSPYWFPNINGYAYIIMVTQHPYGESDASLVPSQQATESVIGYIGPIPLSAVQARK